MKAVRMHGYGGVDQLYYEEADEPRVTQPDEVVVRLKAAAINHIDIWNRIGATGIALEMPHIPGADGAGIIVEVGENVANAKDGINHRKQDFSQVVTQVTEGRGVDVVLDCVAGEVWQKSLAALATGGRLESLFKMLFLGDFLCALCASAVQTPSPASHKSLKNLYC